MRLELALDFANLGNNFLAPQFGEPATYDFNQVCLLVERKLRDRIQKLVE